MEAAGRRYGRLAVFILATVFHPFKNFPSTRPIFLLVEIRVTLVKVDSEETSLVFQLGGKLRGQIELVVNENVRADTRHPRVL